MSAGDAISPQHHNGVGGGEGAQVLEKTFNPDSPLHTEDLETMEISIYGRAFTSSTYLNNALSVF